MGKAKEEQMKDDERIRSHLPKCPICGSPVEGYSETLCYGCRTNLEKDD